MGVFWLMAALFIIMAFFLACLRGSSDCRCDDVSSVAFWYQAEPHFDFPAVAPGRITSPNLSETI
jgi:hypothetical protein